MTLIDAHLPVYQFRELHQLLINAAPGDLLDAVDTPGIVEDPWVQWFIRLREAPGRVLFENSNWQPVTCYRSI
jgi:hypothetical protein